MSELKTHLDNLKKSLQNAEPHVLEKLSPALISRLLDIPVLVASSGFQYGGDSGTAGRLERHLRIECKRYSEKTNLNERELLGEIDQALARDPSLEAWILVTTREVSEQIHQSLTQKGDAIGVPIVVFCWGPDGVPDLAALCTCAPDLVVQYLNFEAGSRVKTILEISASTLNRIRKELQTWSLGYSDLRLLSHKHLHKLWKSPRESVAFIGQCTAGGSQPNHVRRKSVHKALDDWWNSPPEHDSPAAVTGLDGVGKTWAVLEWLVSKADELPITLFVPSSSIPAISNINELSIKQFIADRFHELSGVRDSTHWLRRLERLQKRPEGEGPILTLYFDGINQESSFPWLDLLKRLQSNSFNRLFRVVISSRIHFISDRLGNLNGLIAKAVAIPVEPYDLHPGGEFDQKLAFESILRKDIHPDLIDIARVPRLFNLVVKFRERLVKTGQVTIHRLLWEYGLDTLGVRAGRSFSEIEWHNWLADLADRYREGIQFQSLNEVADSVNCRHLDAREIYSRLSDIVDNCFVKKASSHLYRFRLSPTIVFHALGLALLEKLRSAEHEKSESIEEDLSKWLDPISGLDQRVEILRAAVSIAIERSNIDFSPIVSVLVTAWMQSQNILETHRLELAALADKILIPILDTLERSTGATHATARLIAINALRNIDRNVEQTLEIIIHRTRIWNSVISREVFHNRRNSGADNRRKFRSKLLIERIGIDSSLSVQVLGVEINMVDLDTGILQKCTPSILEGFPLTPLMPVFETVAISKAIVGEHAAWNGIKWLSLLNDLDYEKTAAQLRLVAQSVNSRKPEHGVHLGLPGRAAALLLLLTAREEDEIEAKRIDTGFKHFLDYEEDYLSNPSKSWFPLELRHADIALKDTTLPIQRRCLRCKDMWLDPDFVPPESFVNELRKAAKEIDLAEIDRSRQYTEEDRQLKALEIPLARCEPDLLANINRQKMRIFRNSPSRARYWRGIRATEYLLLARQEESDAARDLRLLGSVDDSDNECHVSGQLLILEAHDKPPIEQFIALMESNLSNIPVAISKIIKPLDKEQADFLVKIYGNKKKRHKRDLLFFLGQNPTIFSEETWMWLIENAFCHDEDLRTFAFMALDMSDSLRFGQELFAQGWHWSPSSSDWINHHGTSALIAASKAIPFDQLIPLIAPWRLLEAARRRGGNPSEVRFAAASLDGIISRENLKAPDPGSTLSVDIENGDSGSGPRTFSVSLYDPENFEDAMEAITDPESRILAYRRAATTAMERIREIRGNGASLHLFNLDSADFEPVLTHAPEFVNKWLDGSSEFTDDFIRRVQISEGAYVALCEMLLKNDPERGSVLWYGLRKSLRTHFNGVAKINELIHIIFRAPDSMPVAQLRTDQLNLSQTPTDESLFNIVIAADFNHQTKWLQGVIEKDINSACEWRKRRAVLMDGFRFQSVNKLEKTWPEGLANTSLERLDRKSSHFSSLNRWAYHWWRQYLNSKSDEQAYAAWLLFENSIDRRVWVWLRDELDSVDSTDSFNDRKIKNAVINLPNLKRAMEKREEKLDERFLDCETVNDIGPWRKNYQELSLTVD
jgi:hypothetical protein